MRALTYLGIPGLADYIRQLSTRFPSTQETSPMGIVCQGGDLSLPLVLAAYSRGIFPWYEENEPILWWSPAPRCVISPAEYHCPRRSLRELRRRNFRITLDAAFRHVLYACGMRKHTWITRDLKTSFLALHEAGFAHSVEAWEDGTLVGGIYGLGLGRFFFGESMFHTESYASRACLKALCELLAMRGITTLDCQQESRHIMAQGGRMLSREDFEGRLEKAMTLDESATDALSEEYADTPAMRHTLWPFLPWKSTYACLDGVWHGQRIEELVFTRRGRAELQQSETQQTEPHQTEPHRAEPDRSERSRSERSRSEVAGA